MCAAQELKARLDLVERQEREAIETARAENLRKKEARIARLTEKASNLGRVRQLAGQRMHQYRLPVLISIFFA